METICKEKYHANNVLFKEVKSGKCDQYRFSPYNIKTLSSRHAMRIKKLINQLTLLIYHTEVDKIISLTSYTVCFQDAKFGHLDYPNTLKISQHCLEVGEYFRQYNEDCRRSPDVFFTLVFILKFQSCSPMKCLLILKTPNPIQRLDSGFLPMCSLCLSTENVFRRKI